MIAVNGIFQWNDLLRAKKLNWVNFSIIDVSFEFGLHESKYAEFTIIIAGIGVFVEIYNKRTLDGMDQDLDGLMVTEDKNED